MNMRATVRRRFEMARKCAGCGKKYASKKARAEEILGKGFFEVLTLADLNWRQRHDIHWRIRFCSDTCADAGKVEDALEKT